MAATVYTQDLVLNLLLRGAGTPPTEWYIALFSENPGETVASELGSDGYVRQAVTFTASLAGTVRNSATIEFGPATGAWSVASHYGVFDAVTGGNLLAYGPFDDTILVAEGDGLTILAGEVEVSLE